MPGVRKVAELTIVPRRIRLVSRARPASVAHVSVEPEPWSPSPIRSRWSERKKASKPSRSDSWATVSRSAYVAPC
jgi:hypothetical protein